MNLPPLTLSLGQVAWALVLGQEPKRHDLDQLNYLRQLGIPFEQGQRPSGSGNRANYSYVEMVEMGVGLWALKHGIKPSVISKFLIGERAMLRELYVQALIELPPSALDAPWVRSRGRVTPLILGEKFLRLHDRYDTQPGKIELIGLDQTNPMAQLFDPVETYGMEAPHRLMPLTRMALQWLAWALEAPPTRPGRKSLKQA